MGSAPVHEGSVEIQCLTLTDTTTPAQGDLDRRRMGQSGDPGGVGTPRGRKGRLAARAHHGEAESTDEGGREDAQGEEPGDR